MPRERFDPAMPKSDDAPVRLVIDFGDTESLVYFARNVLPQELDSQIRVYKMTAPQFHSVPMGNHYIVEETGHSDMRLDNKATFTAKKEDNNDDDNTHT